ncbi:transposase [Streptomyces sp. NPDC005209]|uniref:transposase n=1 Tax=Streptomyces sp. NPDC005209 TaxID=3156715 RepID=UPI0033B73968
MSALVHAGERVAFAELSRFGTAFYGCLSARADAFFELREAPLCADGPVRTPMELSLTAEHRRGYGSLYGASNHGQLDVDPLRDRLASLSLPRLNGRIVLITDSANSSAGVSKSGRTRPGNANPKRLLSITTMVAVKNNYARSLHSLRR